MQVAIRDGITPELRRIAASFARPRSIYAAGAKAVQIAIWAHLDRLQARGNENGWPSQKFFAGKQTSVRKNVGISSLTDSGAVVTIADPRFVHRITGGTVTAKRGKMLSIPLTANAAALGGKGSLRESAPDLIAVRLGQALFLARPTGLRGKGGLEFMFRLLPSVTHKAHPDEMPDVVELGRKAAAAMFQAAQLLMRPGGK